jgi:hypothetical protein
LYLQVIRMMMMTLTNSIFLSTGREEDNDDVH